MKDYFYAGGEGPVPLEAIQNQKYRDVLSIRLYYDWHSYVPLQPLQIIYVIHVLIHLSLFYLTARPIPIVCISSHLGPSVNCPFLSSGYY